jgi:hypothetical protein
MGSNEQKLQSYSTPILKKSISNKFVPYMVWLIKKNWKRPERRHGYPRVLAQHAMRDFNDDGDLSRNTTYQQLTLTVARSWAALTRAVYTDTAKLPTEFKSRRLF